MKKYLFLGAVMVILSLAFVGCSSDDDEDNPFVGTKWVTQNAATSLYGMFDGKEYWHVIEFTSNSTYDMYYEQVKTGIRGNAGYFPNGKYEYKDSHITFYDFGQSGNTANFYKVSSAEIGNSQNRSDCTVIYTKR